MKFIDLFAGLGGFHQALSDLGHECVYACEIDPDLNALYKENWDIEPEFDIRKINLNKIPEHDILCAGFPCQPFSHAAPKHRRKGFECDENGDLFNWVVNILRAKRPTYFILENAPYLVNHNDGQTWKKMVKKLTRKLRGTVDLRYQVDADLFSPEQFGIPQNRKRLFIVGKLEDAPCLLTPSTCVEVGDIYNYLEDEPCEPRSLSLREIECLNVWQDFLNKFPDPIPLPSPIWSREFEASYPYKRTTPDALGVVGLQRWRGNHGKKLRDLLEKEVWQNIPTYAKRGQDRFPDWKIRYIDNNRSFYREFVKKDKVWYDRWKQKIAQFPPTWQRFEWNCGMPARDIWSQIIQFRNSGVRVSATKRIPALVTMVSQVPIIGWKERYLTPRECANFQNIKDDFILPKKENSALKSIGNAVNVKVVSEIAKALIN